jgi:hypothetical protein
VGRRVVLVSGLGGIAFIARAIEGSASRFFLLPERSWLTLEVPNSAARIPRVSHIGHTMPGLTQAISQAESQINANTKGQINSITSGIKGSIQNIQNTVVSGISGAANNAVKSATQSVLGAAGDLLTGNVSGAVSALANAPSNIIGSTVAGLGGFAGIQSLSSPGTVGTMSGTGGVDPGNSLGGINARSDPLLSFCWYAQLPVITPGTSQQTANAASTSILANLASSALSGVLSSTLGGAVSTSNAASLPWYYVEEASLSFRQFNQKSIFREGRDRHYPDKYSVDALRLAIYADSQNTAFTYLQAWNNAIITPFAAQSAAAMGGGWGRPADYKKPIYIYLLDVTQQQLAIVQYTECFPISVAEYSMDSGTSTRIVNHVTFSVGDVFVNLLPVSQNVLASVLGNTANNVLTSSITNFAGLVASGVSKLQGSISGLASVF